MKLTRRSLLLGAGAAAVSAQARRDTFSTAREMTEWIFVSAKPYKDPFNEIELDAIIRDPRGKERRVPAFWATLFP